MNPLNPFAAAVWIRNKFYDRRLFKVRKLSKPVVSIGNISMGGTGKTPFVITLGSLLKDRGIEFDVLSRGYGRQSKEIRLVDPEGSPDQFGDEPLLITRKLGVPVIVGADRYEAGLLAEEKFPQGKLHLLDDGFQHRRLHRDFDVVLVADEDLGNTVLPLGRLREPLSALRRADVIVLPEGTTVVPALLPTWRSRRNLLFIVPMSRVVAFCGIARPQQFFSGLKKLGMDLADTVSFPDHHRYTQADISHLIRMKLDTKAQGFITTEKDAINLGPLVSQLRTFEAASLELELENPAQALDTLLHVLEQRCGLRL
jgi:tetraacyldisaccharide 4'-kinase